MLSWQGIILVGLNWRAPQLLPAASGVGLLALLVSLWLYRPQIHLLAGSMRWLIPGLRGLVIAALAASILRPVAMRLVPASDRGQLLILVDRSRSMSVLDNQRDARQEVALADALGYLAPGTRADVAEPYLLALDHLRSLAAEVSSAQDDLEYARVSGHDIEAHEAHVRSAVDAYTGQAKSLARRADALSTEAPLRHTIDDLAKMPAANTRSRWKNEIPALISAAQSAATNYQGTSDQALYDDNDQVRAAAQQVAQLSRIALIERALLRPQGLVSRLSAQGDVTAMAVSDQPIPIELREGQRGLGAATGYTTDLTGCIAQATAGRKVRAVVLLSDGHQVSGDPTLGAGLLPQGIPIFAVDAAAPTPPRDLSFEELQVPPSVFAGQPFSVKAVLRHEGLSGMDLDLHLRTADGQEQIRRVAIREGKPATADFNLKLTRAGAQPIRLWFEKVEGEVTDANNHIEHWLKVVPQRMKVLLVAGLPEWDFQFVRSALSRSAEIDLSDRVINPGAPKLDIPARQIQQQDVIVLFDVPIKALDAGQWDAVEQLAEREGGSVILAAGGVHLPAEYNKSAPIAVSHLLPYDVVAFAPAWRVWPGESPEFHFTPTNQGRRLTALASEEADGGSWEQLPGCYRFVQLPDRHGEGWRRNVRPLLVESESGLPVLTEMRLGAGRTFFLGLDETWRWRLKQGDAQLDHFWRELIAYAADQPYYARNDVLALDADKVAAQPNEPIHIRARVSDPALAGMRSSSLSVLRGQRVVQTVQLSRAGPVGSGRFAGNVSLPAGDFELQWSLSRPRGKSLSIHMPLHVAASDQAEMADLSGDETMLRKLADATGGQFLRLDQINTLPARIASSGTARPNVAELALWDSPYFFGLVLGCLGAEWALRKRTGLA